MRFPFLLPPLLFATISSTCIAETTSINLNWSHTNFTSNQHLLDTATSPAINGSISQYPKWDAINGEFGQVVHFGNLKSIRFHGGGQFAQIISNFSVPAPGLSNENTFSNFYGFGPRIGADMKYLLRYGFSMYANGAGAILVGQNKFISSSSGLISTYNYQYLPFNTTTVPEIEGKLGIGYTYANNYGHLIFDAGYLWLNYIHSQYTSFTDSAHESDFMLNGPYFGLKWLG